MPPSRRPATTLGGRRIAQGRRRPKNENMSRRSGRVSQQEVDSEEDAYSETADDILARSPPPDKPEHISKTTQRTGMFWAPLISGSTQEEKALMNQELAAAKKYQFPELYHPEYVETRVNDPANLNRQLILAGVPNTPLNLDPPGTGSPFDALKHPKSLLARLNRVPDDPDGLPYGWDKKALQKIPHSIIAKLPPKTLAALRQSFLSTLPPNILARDSEEPPERLVLPVTTRLTRRSQLLSTEEDETSARDPEGPPTRPTLPAISRLTPRKLRLSTEEEGTSARFSEDPSTRAKLLETSRLSNRSQSMSTDEEEMSTTGSEEPSRRPILPAISIATRRNQHLSTEEEDSTSNPEEPSRRTPSPAVSKPTRRSQRMAIRDEEMPDVHDLPVPEETDLPMYQPMYPSRDPRIRSELRSLWVEAIKHPSSSQPPAVRRRGKAAHACDHCRVKRVKCDGVHPSCLSCQNFGVQCSFRGGNAQESDEQTQEVEDEPEEQTEVQLQGQLDGPTEERRPTIAAAEVDYVPVLMIIPQLENRGFATAGDSGPTSDDSDSEDDLIDFEALHRRPFVSVFGITRELAGRFIKKSPTDQLDLSKTTTVPLKFHPKPVFSHMPTFPKRTRARTAHAYNEMRTPQEEIFMSRPSVRIIVPDHLKNLLVDDWENVTKSLLVVPLPSKAPVNFIIDSYFDEEKGKRRLGSAEADVLEEFVAGMKVYFDKAIGKTLLYKFERPQWAEVCEIATCGRFDGRWCADKEP
jgi:hypothetical protein